MIFNQPSTLESNIRAHNRVAKQYESLHGEIYNENEQNRLHEDLLNAVLYIETEGNIKKAIDFGCGAGNLTKHLTSHGLEIIACDVSQGFLDLVSSRDYETYVEVVKLNGKDLSNIPDASVDMIAAYSVLHHVPDYLLILKEFLRVLKKGGVIYIDHETSDEYWSKKNDYIDFELEIKKKSHTESRKYFELNNYIDWIIRKFFNKRYRREGDIHVFKDDHIEWPKITNLLVENGGQILFEKDYLLFKRNYNVTVYNKYKNKISDMHLLIAKKRID